MQGYFSGHGISFFTVSFPWKLAARSGLKGNGSISCEINYSRRKARDEPSPVDRRIESLMQVSLGNPTPEDWITYQGWLATPYTSVVFERPLVSGLRSTLQWTARVDPY